MVLDGSLRYASVVGDMYATAGTEPAKAPIYAAALGFEVTFLTLDGIRAERLKVCCAAWLGVENRRKCGKRHVRDKV